MESAFIVKIIHKGGNMNQNHKIKTEEILNDLEKGVREVFHSARWKEYLSCMARFPSYSFSNILLICRQKPNAAFVAGYRVWQEFDRYVRKGEKGIRILAPLKRKRTEDAEENEEENIPYGYRTVSVFDISQTEGKPLPMPVRSLPSLTEEDPMFLQALLLIAPCPVYFDETPEGVNGMYRPLENTIIIQKNLSSAQNIKTLLHEIAHAILHADSNDSSHEERMKREIEAESIAYTVCARYELDTSAYSFGYIASWSKDQELSELKESMRTIQKTAEHLIEMIDLVRNPVSSSENRMPCLQPEYAV